MLCIVQNRQTAVCLTPLKVTSYHLKTVSCPAQSAGYRWVAADWFPIWCGQLPEPAGPLWRSSASPAGHQAITSSQHGEAHPGRGASLPALCGSWSVGNRNNSSCTCMIYILPLNCLFVLRRKMAAPQRTPQSKRKNMGGASNRTVQWGVPAGGLWGGGCDPVAISLWRGHVQWLLRPRWCCFCSQGLRG